MYGWMMDGAGPVWLVIWIVMALLVVAVAVAVVALVVRSGGPGSSTGRPQASPARDLLDQRYARGEIDHDEYIRRRDELARSGG